MTKADFGLSGENIICFAGEDWWYHHPHSKNHILKRLAQHNRVLFINSITLGLPSTSNPDFWMKVRRKAKSYMRWLRRVPEGLWVMSPITLPLFGHPIWRVVNRHLLDVQVRIAMRLCGISDPVVWVAIPSAMDVVENLKKKAVLYQVSDKYDANEDSSLSADTIREMDLKMKILADVVMYSGKKLYREAVDVPNRYWLEQAVDFTHFAQRDVVVAEDLRVIPHPILFYMGAMDYVMDTELISEVAHQRPDWHWVFVGLKSNLVQVDAVNVHFLGVKSYSELPRYIQHVDVCVLPWRQSHMFTSYGSAIKVREFLASGKPVVISPLYEYMETPGVRIYQSTQDFVDCVEDALYKDTESDRVVRQNQVRDCTWDHRAREVAALIQSIISNRESMNKEGRP